MKRILKVLLLSLGVLAVVSLVVSTARRLVYLPPRPPEFEIIAHRGVHQTFSADNLDNDTCTASRIGPPQHRWLENTIPSMAEAFQHGATMVELDVHPTIENRMVVFHDWQLDCRTEGHGVTHQHSLAELKKLDVGYGYTADAGKTFPFRGTGVGMMPALEEVFAAFPDKKILINQKDTYPRTAEILAGMANRLPQEQRKRLYWYGGGPEAYARLHELAPEITNLFPGAGRLRQCGKAMWLRLGFGELPQTCRLTSIVIPYRYLWLVPGWPNDFLSKAAKARVPVYVIDVDDVGEARRLSQLPINGLMTNKIEVVGPALTTAASHGN